MYFREYVEQIMVHRLIKPCENEVEVDDVLFQELSKELQKIINSMAKYRNIMGFTCEDLESFMYLKLHQLLRQQKCNFATPYSHKQVYPFFRASFNNLLNDINRMTQRAISAGMSRDAMDDCKTFIEGIKDIRHKNDWRYVR